MKAETKPAAAKEPAPGDKKRARAPAVKATQAPELPAAPGKKTVKRTVVAKASAAPAKANPAPAKKAAAPRKAPAKAAELVIETTPAPKKPAVRKRVKAAAPVPEVLPPEVELLSPVDAAAANDAAVVREPPAGATTIAVAVEMVIEDDSIRRHRIAVEAYLIAESRGFPQGCDELHWLEAERKLYGNK